MSRRKRVAVGSRNADRGRTANDHGSNCIGNLGRRTAFDLDLFEWKPALVEEDDAIVLEPEDPLRLEQA